MRNDRKILYVTTLDITVSSFLIPHIKALQKRGYDVEVACKLGEYASSIRKEGISVHDIPFSRNPLSGSNLLAFFKLLRLLKEKRYDLVHVHTPVAAFWGRLAARLSGSRMLYTAHGFHFVSDGGGAKNLVFLSLEKIASYWTDALIVINDDDLKAASRYRLAQENAIFRVNGVGIDIKKFIPDVISKKQKEILKIELGCNDDRVVGMIGEFNANKRQIDLVNAAQRVLQQEPGTTFLFIGEGVQRKQIERFAASKISAHKTKFLGKREDIPELLSVVDVLVLPSLREGLPRTIQEAMACGKPVVVSNIRGNRDLVDPGETGLLVPPKDPEALADAILKILVNPHLAQRMGEKARKKAVRELDVRKVIDQIITIHENVIGR